MLVSICLLADYCLHYNSLYFVSRITDLLANPIIYWHRILYSLIEEEE